MIIATLKKKETWLVAGSLVLFIGIALWLRLLPLITRGTVDPIDFLSMDDPFYNLRQVEQILANFPHYAWYDAMTRYPTGTGIYWGPLFPMIISTCCLLAGAATRPEIISTALLVPPLMAAVTVAVMYFAGKCFGSWKTGILAAGFTAIISGQFFFCSIYGYPDHHIAEVLFSTIFCLVYSCAILSGKETAIDLRTFSSYRRTALLAFLAGLAYLAGLFVMPTMILFAMIVAIFTLVQVTIDYFRNRTSEYLLLINAVVFATAFIGLLLFGLRSAGLGLSEYSAGHLGAYAGLIIGTVVLYLLSRILSQKNRFLFPVSIAGIVIVLAGILALAFPDLFSGIVGNLSAFFGQEAVTDTVLEARGWSPESAWLFFSYGLLLFFGGALVLVYQNIKDEKPHQVFALVWSAVILYSTWQHVRYEYYLGINIALLAAVCVTFAISHGKVELSGLFRRTGTVSPAARTDPDKRTGQKRRSRQAGVPGSPDYKALLLPALAIILSILFVYQSVSIDYSVASGRSLPLDPDWREAMEWMEKNTPDPGVDYYAIHDPETFRYPPEAYGVMSWWDYGHLITYIAKRIPNANPFQQGVAGPTGAAAFFVSTSEDTADGILDVNGTRYVVIDYQMDWEKFGPMATWYNASAGLSPFMMEVLVPEQNSPANRATRLLLNKPLYYETMVSRLYNFDGSMAKANSTIYVEYAGPAITGTSLPVVTKALPVNKTEGISRVKEFNNASRAGYSAVLLSSSVTQPIDDVPALRHYRLIHESPRKSPASGTVDLKYVKVYEYVKGAHIKGTGIIEVPVVTNTGRTYIYRQESIDGEFIVPYSTTGNPYGVKTTGPYQVSGTGQKYEVPESAVIQGLAIP